MLVNVGQKWKAALDTVNPVISASLIIHTVQTKLSLEEMNPGPERRVPLIKYAVVWPVQWKKRC